MIIIYICKQLHNTVNILCQIYNQVIYDKSGVGRKLGMYTGISLAWWHNYKWVSKRILIVFANDFLAPVFHTLFPDKEFSSMKMKHTSITTILTYVRLAYPYIREYLTTSLNNPLLNVKQRVMLSNLKAMCEFFIPVVLPF